MRTATPGSRGASELAQRRLDAYTRRDDQLAQVVLAADEHSEAQLRDVFLRPQPAPVRVDRDGAAAGAEDAEQRCDVRGPVPQDDSDLGPGPGHQVGDARERRVELTPRVPAPRELQRRRAGVDPDDRADPVRERTRAARRHRVLGFRFAGGCAATSAMPIGFPRRV
jgi:hypothetical protein